MYLPQSSKVKYLIVYAGGQRFLVADNGKEKRVLYNYTYPDDYVGLILVDEVCQVIETATREDLDTALIEQL